MKYWILKNQEGKIIKSAFDMISVLETGTVQECDTKECKYSIKDCLLQGTPFQLKVWNAIAQIPIGKTKTYGELVAVCGGAPQAIGSACGKNRIPVIIPCHRVVGKTNPLAYSGGNGAETKRQLLAEEGIFL